MSIPARLSLIVALTAATGLAPSASGQSSISDAGTELCMQQPASQVPVWQAQGVSADEIRRRLEIAFAHCRAPLSAPAVASFIGAVNADLARAALAFLEGKISYGAYTALIADRNRKYELAQSDPTFRSALASGDTDADLIPDALDSCPHTPDLVPTDNRGCPENPTPCSSPFGVCESGAMVQGALRGLNIMFNKSCDDAPPPATPAPLDWGRGRQGAPNTFGFNLLIARVVNEPAGCEVFYEVEFRFTGGKAGAPPVIYANAIFSERESLTNDSHVVMFPLKTPLAGERLKLVGGMGNYTAVSWRVRAVNGSQRYSPWSGVRVQWADPKGLGL